jgi:RNA polymerase sigma factor (sigma-70 family)
MGVQAGSVVRSLGLLFVGGTHCGLADAELLDRFVTLRGDDAAHAFEGLVMRHGPMVLDLCRRTLGDPHEAQDAFQATFLVLATRARTIRRRKSVGSWLHGVALRVARRARREAARRRALEHRIAAMMTGREAATDPNAADDRDFGALHEEVGRLPRKYREAVVLCYLEGLSLEAAAGQLGCPVGTLGVRLMRARERLRTRLTGRGIAGANGLLLASPAAGPLPVVLSGELVRSTVGAAMQAAGGIGGAVPTVAGRLAGGVSRRMTMLRLTPLIAGIVVATGGMATLGVVVVGRPEPRAAGKAARRSDGQPAAAWVGKKAVIKGDAPLRDADRAVDAHLFRVFVVERTGGDRLRLVAADVAGWIEADEVVLLDQAIDYFTGVIRQEPGNQEARLRRAQIRDYLGDRAQAIADLTEAIALGPPNAAIMVNRGVMYREQGEQDKAIADYSEAIRLRPDWALTHFFRGQSWHAKGKHDKAIADYDEAIRLDPHDGLAFLNRGLARSHQELDRAIADFTEAIRLGPSDTLGSKLGSAYNYRGQARQEKGDTDAAIVDLNEAIRLTPSDASAYQTRGLAWSDKGEYDKAIADLGEAVRLDPKNALAFLCRGGVWIKKQEYNKAIADLDEATRLDPTDPRALLNRGLARACKKEHDKAIVDFEQAIRLDPTDSAPHARRGFSLLSKEEYDRAIADFDEAIRLNSKDAFSYSNRGLARFFKEEYDRAIADFDEALRLDPKLSYALLHRGWAWFETKEYAKALTDFDGVIPLDPENAEAHAMRGWIRATSPDPKYRDGKKAVESATRACELTKWSETFPLSTLAAALAESGDFEAAVKWQTRANALYKDDNARAEGEDLLELYRKKQPRRDPSP